jgi:RHS repeat-associated protein
LTDANSNVTDTYDYDAFGNLINQTGSTPNNYLYSGEQFDADLGLYYNRARYLDVRMGRFWGMDTFEGFPFRPRSLHGFNYASSDPVDLHDPSGNMATSTAEAVEVASEVSTLSLMSILQGATLMGMLANDLLSMEREQQRTGQFLYRFGNAGGPYPPRVPLDIQPDNEGKVGPKLPWPDGASVYSNWELAPLRGWFYKITKASVLPSLGVVADGVDAEPPGPHSATHHTIFPLFRMAVQDFVDLFMCLPWQKVAKKP